jgi:hypothetical protein
MTEMIFQTKVVLVKIKVNNILDMREIYNEVAAEYGVNVAAECVELAMNGDYLLGD